MASIKKLSATEIEDRMARIRGWSVEGAKLHKEYTFKDFVEAFEFMTRVARIAEEQAHHPEWFNVYNTLRVHLSTHEVGGITDRDFRLARAMDELG